MSDVLVLTSRLLPLTRDSSGLRWDTYAIDAIHATTVAFPIRYNPPDARPAGMSTLYSDDYVSFLSIYVWLADVPYIPPPICRTSLSSSNSVPKTRTWR